MNTRTFTNELEILTVLDTDREGRIQIPSGSAMEMDSYLRRLSRLRKAGLVARSTKTAFYRPFVLTPNGRKLRLAFLEKDFGQGKNREEIRRAVSAPVRAPYQIPGV